MPWLNEYNGHPKLIQVAIFVCIKVSLKCLYQPEANFPLINRDF